MPSKRALKDGVSKYRAPRKSPATDQNLRFLWAYVEQRKGATIPHKEVAEKLGMNVNAVRTRFYGIKAYIESLDSSAQVTTKKAAQKGKATQPQKKGNAGPSNESGDEASASAPASSAEETDIAQEDKEVKKANVGLESGDGAGCEEGHKDSEEARAQEDEAYLLELFPDV